MNTRILTAALGSAAATLGVTLAVAQFRTARGAAVELLAASEKYDALQTRVAASEDRVRQAERRASEAERDTTDLLRAVESVGARHTSDTVEMRNGLKSERARPTPGTATEVRQVLHQIDKPPVAVRRPTVAAPAGERNLGPGTGTVDTPDATITEEEKEQLAQERAYQQELAKRRQKEAMIRASIVDMTRDLDPAAKYLTLVEWAEQLTAGARFEEAHRAFNEAIATRPAEVSLTEGVLALQRTLAAQNSPVEIALASDGATFVSVAGIRSPTRFITATVNLMPGDYEIVGRRRGYRDARTPLQVRSGMSPPTVPVMCTTPVAP